MPDDGCDGAVTESKHESQGILQHIKNTEGADVAVIVVVPAGGATIASLVRSDDVKARRSNGQHHLSPAVRELRKAVQEQDTGAIAAFETRLQQVHGETVDAFHDPRAYTGRQITLTKCGGLDHPQAFPTTTCP